MRSSAFRTIIIALFCGTAAVAVQAADWTPMPTTTAFGTRGLSQTASAQSLGAGRLNLTVQGAWYQQKDVFPGTPNSGANIATGIGALAFGVSGYFDVFGGVNFYDLTKYDAATKYGLGTVTGGIQATLPLPKASPIFLAMQGAVLGGLSKNQVDSNHADGYNYFETRTGYDIMAKLLQSLVLGSDVQGFALHFNEGFVKSTEPNKDILLVLAGGIQGNLLPFLAIGVEANSRTFYQDREFKTDPVWITPTIIFRTPALLSFTVGCDVSASQKRANDPASKSLESYRVFGNMQLSIDCLEGKRRAAAEKAKTDSAVHAQYAQCRNEVLQVSAARDGLLQQMKADSILCKRSADSLAAVNGGLLRTIQMDSAALLAARLEYNRLLAIEKERRSDIEKKLLSTGMLILDAVYFESGKTEISLNSKPYLKIIGKMLERYPKLELEIGGHTDNLGSAEKNQQLSQLRAEAVRGYLIQVAPGLVDRLSAMGYGSSMPKADNRKAAGRKINRRVEIRVLNPDVLKEYN
jgi:outer membrane protein OmpA-like peptidoglycan-associated protein